MSKRSHIRSQAMIDMRKFYDTSNEENRDCEICWANTEPIDHSLPTSDVYWINTHCTELRRNREARENKKIKAKETVF